jgi:RecT family
MSNLAVRSTLLTPSNLTEAMEYAKLIASSAIVPKAYQGKPSDILVAVQMGAELGLKPIQALQNIAVINSRPSVYGDALLALVQVHPSFEDIKEWFDEKTNTAFCTVKRKNQSEHTVSFSAEDAKKASLWGKSGPWSQYPKRMMQMRARGFALRDKFADALGGLITSEEAQDYPVEAGKVDVTPKAQTLSARLDKFLEEPEALESILTIPNNENCFQLQGLIAQHNISQELVSKWCDAGGVATLEELDNNKVQLCIDYIIKRNQDEKYIGQDIERQLS